MGAVPLVGKFLVQPLLLTKNDACIFYHKSCQYQPLIRNQCTLEEDEKRGEIQHELSNEEGMTWSTAHFIYPSHLHGRRNGFQGGGPW